MKKEFIPYEQALELKKLGFNEICIFYYDCEDKEWVKPAEFARYNYNVLRGDILAPLYQQAFKFFREKYGLMGVVDCFFYNFSYTYNINDIENEKIITRSSPDDDFTFYEAAELACLKKLIEIAKNK